MQGTESELKRTPLYETHKELGGKIVGFAGWELPVRYSGILEEHHAVRQKAGLFDVSHMGELVVKGKDALAFINYCTCNDLSVVADGRAQYNAIMNPEGGIVDDIIVYRMGPEDFFICVNASNADKDFAYLEKQKSNFDVVLENHSDKYAQVAIQGPRAEDILAKVFGESVRQIEYFAFSKAEYEGSPVIIARTGYTGEDGFEIFVSPTSVRKLWMNLLEQGQPEGLIPCGLGARDSLRLEACYPLHGHELSDAISALESGLGWIVKLDKTDFIAKPVLQEQKTNGAPRKLVGFVVNDQAIVREETKLFDQAGNEIGVVTSGTKSPTLDKSLGMALIKKDSAKLGTEIFADVRGKKRSCQIVKLPFYKRSK